MTIKFYSQYSNLIKNGNKTQTLRCWTKCKYKVNDIITLDCKQNVYKAVIINISNIMYSELTDDIAIKDGFANLLELQKALKKTYFYIKDIEYTNFYLISWKVL